ncbi:hypothetical protein chiPu_0023934 [Chiloscyllium punctatum]|uniref:Uncharacterized protein n=1 Tax=Chiloscyllium punctatum TaxID=137246 RepID=A0A401TAN6_CHIPU|nr:hypothetical protein [Chiloscyllium punctatum]
MGGAVTRDCINKNDDPDVIRTRSLLIWSQTRYRCATRSEKAAPENLIKAVARSALAPVNSAWSVPGPGSDCGPDPIPASRDRPTQSLHPLGAHPPHPGAIVKLQRHSLGGSGNGSPYRVLPPEGGDGEATLQILHLVHFLMSKPFISPALL